MIERPADPASRDALLEGEPFRALRANLVDDLFACTKERLYDDGETVIRQGARGDALLVVVEGTAHVVLVDHGGDERTIGDVSRGGVLGEMSLITQAPATANVVAISPLKVLALSSDDFHALAGRNPELTIVLTNLVADRLGQAIHDGLGGKVLSGYRIVRCVGRGGMAVVYEAIEEKGGDRVALKMMSHRLVYHPGAFSRFEREARIVEPLSHPNIARMRGHFPAFRTEFIVMEFLDGETWSDILARRGPFPEEQARRLLGQLAGALAFVHEKGVVHRDLKPSNVMLTREGLVKLMDFGLAKEEAPLSDDTATRNGTVQGTPLYMAPEQIAGDEAGPRMDVYAFACIAYELVAAEKLFRGRTMSQIFQEKMTKRLPPAREIGPGVSREYYDLLVEGLKPNPDNRLASLERIAQWAGRPDPEYLP
jgi:eukaryotic-like serine/threonine-protein kinase